MTRRDSRGASAPPTFGPPPAGYSPGYDEPARGAELYRQVLAAVAAAGLPPRHAAHVLRAAAVESDAA